MPLVVRWPECVKPGTKSERVVGFEDFLPTLAQAAGAKDTPVTGVDGISFLPTLLGEKQEERPFLYREFSGYGGQVIVRMGNWKAVRQKRGKQMNAPVELYNLAEDISESTNVAAAHPEIVARAERLIKEQHIHSEIFPIKALD